MAEKRKMVYLDPDGHGAELYVIERSEEGRYVLVPCGLEALETREISGTAVAADAQAPPAEAARTAAIRNVRAQNAVTLGEYAQKWLDSLKWQIKESSYIKYWNLLNTYIIPELGNMQWYTLNRGTVELFVSRLLSVGGQKKSGLSSRTVSDVMAVLRRVFRYAADCGAAMPFNISSITVKKESKEMRILTEAEGRKLYRYLRGNLNDRNIGLLICLFTGLRLGEICALRWEDISFSEHTIYVHQAMQRIQIKDDGTGKAEAGRRTKIIITPPKSRSSVRKIPMTAELAMLLSAYRGNRRGYVLTGRTDSCVEPRTMERHFKKVLEKAGLENVNFHALRHTFATRCVEMEFDVKSLSEILGHANVNITLNRYVHPTMELKRRNMQKLSALMAVGW